MLQHIRSAVIAGTVLYLIGAWIYVSGGEIRFRETLVYLPITIAIVFVLGLIHRLKQKAFKAGQKHAATLMGEGTRRRDAIQRE